MELPLERRTRVLFVTWDGPQVQYLENLYLPIFAGLARRGFDFDVLQFSWGGADVATRARQACERYGVGYRRQNVLRAGGGAGAFVTALAGAWPLRRAISRFGSSIVLVRSIMPALIALRARPLPVTVVFDADGLPIDERAEFGGLSTTSGTYRVLRDVEAQMLRRADAVLTRTEAAARILQARAGPGLRSDAIHIVANGSDPDVFKPVPAEVRAARRAQLGVGRDAPLLIYVGSIGAQYRLRESLSLLAELRRLRSDARLLILTGEPDAAASEVTAAGIADGVFVRTCTPPEVAEWVAAADIGTAYRQTGYSMVGVSPVKIGEYLLCGTPVVGTAAIGASRAAVATGVFVDEGPGPTALARSIAARLADQPRAAADRETARQVGLADYSLARAVEGYADVLDFAFGDRCVQESGRC